MGTGTGAASAQPRPLSRAAAAIRDLNPGSFAFVMATGIISTGTFLLGPSWLSRALLAVASIGLVVLSVALGVRLVIFRSSVAADIQAPERVFGFFTIVAGIDVLGLRLQAAGHPLATAILAGLAALVWLVLTYGVPAGLLLDRERDSVLGGVNGTWLLWVVGTQSLSLAASVLVPTWPSQSGLLAPAAVGLWSVGLVLYLLLVSLILLRWLTVAITPPPSARPTGSSWVPRRSRSWQVHGSSALPLQSPLPGRPPPSWRDSHLPSGRSAPGGSRCSSCSASGGTSGATGRSPTSRRSGAWSSSRHVQRGNAGVRQGRPSQLHAYPQSVHALGGRRCLGSGGRRLPRRSGRRPGKPASAMPAASAGATTTAP